MAWALNAMNVNSVAMEASKASSLRMELSPGELTTGKIEHTAPAMATASRCGCGSAVPRRLHESGEMSSIARAARARPSNAGYEAAPATATFSLVPVSGISAAAFSPACTLGTVVFTSVIGRPWVGAMILTSSRAIR